MTTINKSDTSKSLNYRRLYGDQARYFDIEKQPRLKHDKLGTVSMVNNGSDMCGSQVNCIQPSQAKKGLLLVCLFCLFITKLHLIVFTCKVCSVSGNCHQLLESLYLSCVCPFDGYILYQSWVCCGDNI